MRGFCCGAGELEISSGVAPQQTEVITTYQVAIIQQVKLGAAKPLISFPPDATAAVAPTVEAK